MLDFLNRGNFDPAINKTYIALIPKVVHVSSVNDFRLISLCNVFYKLISKVLTNRLKLVLPLIISKHQSAFVPGRPQTIHWLHMKLSRGIRQGDPLFPYLFLLCAECLSSLITNAEMDGRISGVPVAVNGFRLSHLFFADDSLIFFRANFPHGQPCLA